MNKLWLILLLTVIIFSGLKKNSIAQEYEDTDYEVNIEKMRVPILPTDNMSKYANLKDEIAILINRVKKEVGLRGVIVGVELDSAFVNLDSLITQDMIIDFKWLQISSEAIVVAEATMQQQHVSLGKDKNYFTSQYPVHKSPAGHDEELSNNIKTELYVLAHFVDVETGDYLGSLDEKIIYIGGTREQSKRNALKALGNKVENELRRIYWLSADIVKSRKGIITTFLGASHGIKKGELFEIIAPAKRGDPQKDQVARPGGIVGLAAVENTFRDSTQLKVIRQWQDFYAGSWVVEHPNPVSALQLVMIPPLYDYFNIGLQFVSSPVTHFDWGLGMFYSQVKDSYEDENSGLGFTGFGLWRFWNSPKLDISAKLGIDLDIPFRRDDDDELVNTLLFSAHVGMVAEFPLSQKFDFVFHTGYRFGIKTDDWEYSVDDETIPAFWESEAPEVDNSGFMFSVGYKFYLF